MDNKPLTPTQKQVLTLMRKHGLTAFMSAKGVRNGLQSQMGRDGFLIAAYQGPDHFLRARGLIERVERNVPGYWYRLTEDGARRAATIRT